MMITIQEIHIRKIILKVVVDVAGKTTTLAVVVGHPNRLVIKVVGMEVAMLHIPDKNNQENLVPLHTYSLILVTKVGQLPRVRHIVFIFIVYDLLLF